jgi:hypothetical protein
MSSKAKTTMASQADIHALYEKAVQEPESDVEFYNDTYQKIRGNKPMVLREDFCGTALISTEWCKSDPARTAIGVDLDGPTLEWGKQHNLQPAGEDIASRIELIQANVLEVKEPKADITCAMNFSYNIFRNRDALREYFAAAHAGLKEDGIFILDMFGGTEAMDEMEEERDIDEDDDVTYVWDQDSFNPITNEINCYIHFNFSDGSEIQRAFTYNWRLWSIPEAKELMLEAGFSNVRVYWEKFIDSDDDDDELEGTGEYYEAMEVDNQESWIIYIVAEV